MMSRVPAAALVVLGAAVAVLALAWVFQRQLIYLPSGGAPSAEDASAAGAEEVALATEDGLELRAWFVPAATGEAAGTVVVFPGNAGNRAARAPLAGALSRAGLSVLLVDYRGYGGNLGSPSEAGLLVDGRAAVAYVSGRPDVDPDRVVLLGESLGAGVASALAVEHPPRALVLRSPFTSLADAAGVHYPFLPAGLLLRDRYRVEEQVARYPGPVLVVAGEHDTIVPPAQSRRVADAAAGPSRFTIVPGADHNDAALLDGDVLLEAITAFLRDAAGLPVAPSA